MIQQKSQERQVTSFGPVLQMHGKPISPLTSGLTLGGVCFQAVVDPEGKSSHAPHPVWL